MVDSIDGDMGPDEAASYARGDRETAGAAEMGSEGLGNTDMQAESDSLLKRLFDGSLPGPQVGQLEADYEMDKWLALVSRGALRVGPGDGSGVPPIVEIIGGAALGARKMDTGDESESETTVRGLQE
jgi:hypothetical protein